MMARAVLPAREGFVEVVGQTIPFSLDDPVLEAPFDRPSGPILLFDRSGLHVREQLEDLLERVVGFRATVVDQIKSRLLLFGRDSVQRLDTSCMHDGSVESVLDGLV